MTRRYLWICDTCHASESSDDDQMPNGWSHAYVWAEGPRLMVGAHHKNEWISGIQCWACHVSLDTLMRDWKSIRFMRGAK